MKQFRMLYPFVDAIIISDYKNGIMTELLIEQMRAIAKNKPVIVDAKNLQKYKLLQPTAVKPNYKELVCTVADVIPAALKTERTRE